MESAIIVEQISNRVVLGRRVMALLNRFTYKKTKGGWVIIDNADDEGVHRTRRELEAIKLTTLLNKIYNE